MKIAKFTFNLNEDEEFRKTIRTAILEQAKSIAREEFNAIVSAELKRLLEDRLKNTISDHLKTVMYKVVSDILYRAYSVTEYNFKFIIPAIEARLNVALKDISWEDKIEECARNIFRAYQNKKVELFLAASKDAENINFGLSNNT